MTICTETDRIIFAGTVTLITIGAVIIVPVSMTVEQRTVRVVNRRISQPDTIEIIMTAPPTAGWVVRFMTTGAVFDIGLGNLTVR